MILPVLFQSRREGAAMGRGIISLIGIALLVLPAPACCADAARAIGEDSGPKAASDAFAITLGGALLSDYLYRGISLSDRGPSVSSSVEVARGGFYVSGQVYTVRLPTDPAAELTLTGGIRREVAGVEFDLSAEYYYYPGETPAPGSGTTNYWQYGISASRRIFDAFEIVGRATYAPNSWNSGAWGAYGSGEIKIDLPKFKLPNQKEVTWTLGAELGHQSFGTTSQGSALPSYAHWRLGAAFKYDVLSFDLSYHDTNLSTEDCFVLAGDSATSGVGRFGANPDGLQSHLCGRALVATLSFEFKPPRS
jgi:uncharacterized protein (TIGR02001 family)